MYELLLTWGIKQDLILFVKNIYYFWSKLFHFPSPNEGFLGSFFALSLNISNL